METQAQPKRLPLISKTSGPSKPKPNAEALACTMVGLKYPQSDTARIRVGPAGRESRGGISIPLIVGETTTELLITRRDDAVETFTRTRHLNLGYRGQGAPPQAVAVLERLGRRLERATWDDIHRLSQSLEAAGSTIDKTLERGVHEAWAHEDRWRMFLATEEIARARDTLVQVHLPWIQVEHGDFECQFVGIGDFVSYPWRSPWDHGNHNLSDWAHTGKPQPQPARGFLSDMEDMEVIQGGTDRLSGLLDALDSEEDTDLVSVNCTCVPMIIGDDVESVVKEQRKHVQYPILFKDQRELPPYGRHIEVMAVSLREAKPVEQDPHAVNLVGFREGVGLDDLRMLLARAGVGVNQSLIPSMHPGMMDEYRRGAVQVFLPNTEWQDMAEYLLGESGLTSIYPDSPFGFEPSLRWLQEVTASVGLRTQGEQLVTELRAELAPRWEASSKKLDGFGLGLVIEPRDVPLFTEPARFYSLPLLPMLEEMGLAIRVAVYGGQCQTREKVESELLGVFVTPERHRIDWYADPKALDQWLANDDVQLIYTDYLYDRRVTGARKTPFSVHNLEMGPYGALRSLERIITLTEMTFFRNLGQYLKPKAAI